MPRDITIRATWRILEELGYCVTSARSPSRQDNSRYYAPLGTGHMLSLGSLSDHPAAILTYPTPSRAPEFANLPRLGMKRGIVILVVTAYLLSDAKQTKAVMSVLERRKLTSGPFRVDSFGNREYPLRWNEEEPLWNTLEARQAHSDDDRTVIFRRQAEEPSYRYDLTDQYGRNAKVATSEPTTDIFEIEGEWPRQHILDTPREELPELSRDSLEEIIADVERARWGARPAAVSKEAA